MSDDTPQTNGSARRQLVIAVASVGIPVLLAFVSAIWWLSSLESRVGSLENNLASQRGEFTGRFDTIGHRQGDLELSEERVGNDVIRLEEAQKEIETQFHAADQLSDIRIAEDLRWRCMFFEKIYGQACASIAYFPQIAKAQTAP